jgi:hypothetical protein
MRTLAVAIVVMLAPAPALAQGVVMVMRHASGAQTTTAQTQMDRNHVRSEVQANGESNAFVFDGQADLIRMINLSRKSYIEMSRADMQQMQQQIAGAMAKMEAQLKNLPPEQRKMLEDMMKGRGGMPGGAAAPPRITYKAAGNDRVGQWACAKYDGYNGADKVTELCTVQPAAIGLNESDFAAMKQMAEFVKSMMPDAAEQFSVNATVAEQGFAGVPIRRVAFRNGKPTDTTELLEVRREAIPASAWEVPAGFTRQQIGAAGVGMTLGGGRGRGQ